MNIKHKEVQIQLIEKFLNSMGSFSFNAELFLNKFAQPYRGYIFSSD
jgi:hypothetical protein